MNYLTITGQFVNGQSVRYSGAHDAYSIPQSTGENWFESHADSGLSRSDRPHPAQISLRRLSNSEDGRVDRPSVHRTAGV